MQETMTLNCTSCGCDFEFTRIEQEAFLSKGFDTPKRCPECRRKKVKSGDTRYQKDKKKHYRMKYGA